MRYEDFLDRVIETGMEVYDRGDGTSDPGCLTGLKLCRGLEPDELAKLWRESCAEWSKAYNEGEDHFWYVESKWMMIGWVCAVVQTAFPEYNLSSWTNQHQHSGGDVTRLVQDVLRSEGCIVIRDEYRLEDA